MPKPTSPRNNKAITRFTIRLRCCPRLLGQQRAMRNHPIAVQQAPDACPRSRPLNPEQGRGRIDTVERRRGRLSALDSRLRPAPRPPPETYRGVWVDDLAGLRAPSANYHALPSPFLRSRRGARAVLAGHPSSAMAGFFSGDAYDGCFATAWPK